MTIRARVLNAFGVADKRLDQTLTAKIQYEAETVGKSYGRMLEISHEEDIFEANFPYHHSDEIYDDEFGPEGEPADPFIRRFLNDISEDDITAEFDLAFEEEGLL